MRARWLLPLVLGLLGLLPLLSATAVEAQSSAGGPQAKVTNPHGPIAIPCQECHSYTSWKPIRSNPEFNHDQTGYPLRGMHAKVACTQCHTNLVFRKISTQCGDCHADIHRRQFGANCQSCHTVRGWQTSLKEIRDHQNRFPLIGAHALLQCDDCHKNAAAGQFVGLSTSCYSCHQKDFQTPVLNHVAAGFPTTCESCHTMDSWFNAKFDHLKYTGYALTGAHATLPCTACHINNVYAGTPASCYACHQSDFTGATSPNHVAAGFPTDCALCHTTSAWTPSTFNHTSVFPLTGAHATVPCAQCHINNNYTTLPTTCFGCHQSDWKGTTNPGHAAAGFPTTCDTCHNTSNWTTVNFNHAQYANYPLTGVHATLTCVQCHVNNNYANTSTACYSCHQADFNGATSPNHVASGFPTDCSICHTTSGWSPSSFNHNNTSFPLTGAHTTLNCVQCHTNNNYTTLPTACYGCHQTDWNGTTDPNHAAAGFPTTCDTCHTTTAWTGATFNHNNTPFPLTGAHVSVDCIKCHVNNVFAGTPTACYSCHQADFTGTTNPNHVAAGWPTTCTTCHTTTAWIPATLPSQYHTFFPLNHGNANGVCATCHTNSNDYSVFQCTGCHTAASTDPEHRGISGYVYNSVNCYACHKNGGG
ncbi:MAG TPA: hypothetical protein VFB43_10445 [Terracidiphilus sp.]|nr:hypothetical protein [Terracidiphilus sp.]